MADLGTNKEEEKENTSDNGKKMADQDIKKEEENTSDNDIKKEEENTSDNDIKKEEENTSDNDIKKEEENTSDNDIKKEEENTSDNDIKKEEENTSDNDTSDNDTSDNDNDTSDNDTSDNEAVISKMKEFRKIERTFSEYNRKIYKEIEAKTIEVVDMVREFGEEMKDEAWQYLEDTKKEIKSTAHLKIKNPEYLGISFEEVTTTEKKIEKLFGTIRPCAGKIITQEQRDEFYKLPEVFSCEIVDDFNCKDFTKNKSQQSSKKEAGDRCSWRFKVSKQEECLLFKPIIKKPEEGPLNLIIHFRIYLIWNNEPQRYLQLYYSTEDEPEYQKLLVWKKLTDKTKQFTIHCILQNLAPIVNANFPKISYPNGGKKLTKEEINDYYLTVIPIQIEYSFSCKALTQFVSQGSKQYTTNLGFSFGFEVKERSNFLCVRPVLSYKEDLLEPILQFKFYLIWKEEPQYYLKMDRNMKKTNPAFQNLIFWNELTANTTDQFKIRCVLQNAHEIVKLNPKK